MARIQRIRIHGIIDGNRLAVAQLVVAVTDDLGAVIEAADDLDAAIAAGTDGAHIGQGDMSPEHARALLGPGKILGLSCETPDTVRAADPGVVDYLGLGPVFGTATKVDHKAPVGFDGLARLVALSPLPNVAIGGLKAHHHAEVLAAGADGSAVVSAICGQPDIAAATRAFSNVESM